MHPPVSDAITKYTFGLAFVTSGIMPETRPSSYDGNESLAAAELAVLSELELTGPSEVFRKDAWYPKRTPVSATLVAIWPAARPNIPVWNLWNDIHHVAAMGTTRTILPSNW